MSDNINKIDLNGVLTPQTLIELSGVKIESNLRDTLETNLYKRDNNGDYITPTKIIFNYVRFVNDTQLRGVDDKKEYVKTAKILLDELNECGFVVGDEWRNNKKLPYSKGNNKLSKDTVIINLSPSSLCISKNLNLCEVCGVCYALSSERRYLNTLIYRLTQLVRFEELSVEEIVNQLSRMRVFNYLRVNESGDIFNMGDVFKLLQIARELWDKKGVTTYLYTHRRDLWDVIKQYQTHFFKVNRSGVDFITKDKITPSHKSLFCDGECEGCIYCKVELNMPVTALYHGDRVGEDLRDEETIKRDEFIKKTSYDLFKMEMDVRDIEEYIKTLLNIPFNPYNGEDVLSFIDLCDDEMI